ncbi:hypothetical protein B0H66DRAFT_606865 [Apodospora peruviana]|uniref:Nephrocystin 3-like N-terminal domain-containing protein n=1 Tax=Apodospora peruviana TaxID=516989 RepID=A0AAE0LZS4_9PEZI|nr:hypothetical protein B0H66DRAFT_606865 [Apodospora peruviana]
MTKERTCFGALVLWCFGGPGTGKTVLASVIIDHLLDTGCPVTFVYFDYQNQTSQAALTMLSSVLRQIVSTLDKIPECVKNICGTQDGEKGRLILKRSSS